MPFRVLGLDPLPFQHLYGLDDAALQRLGARRYVVDASPGFPDRVEVRDAEPGETVILLNYLHQPGDTPYRASHAIFVREHASVRCDVIDTVPAALQRRTISLRAFDAGDNMLDADLAEGAQLAPLIQRFFNDLTVAYLQAHYAKQGCYAARIERR